MTPTTMTVVYAREEPPGSYTKSLFLAGPTPRNVPGKRYVESWRPLALSYLEQQGYDGVVFVPEDRPDSDGVTRFKGDYIDQVEWEETCLHLADVIVFWLPRDTDLPGYTTNDEWGYWKDSGKVVFGAPDDALKVKYQQHYADKLHVPSARSCTELLDVAIAKLGAGSLRTGGEREVPLYIWNTPHFQSWYNNLRMAGNRLDHARVEWVFLVGPERNRVFIWSMHVDIWVESEQRSKTNEVVLSRPDISTVVLYRRAACIEQSLVVLVREFRSPVSNSLGFVVELPGGSSPKPTQDPLEVAAHECEEETGLKLPATRFGYSVSRQVAATLSTHHASVFFAELTDQEVSWLRSQQGVAHGVESDSERTYVELRTFGEIQSDTDVDWSMIGMITQVLIGG